MKRINGLVLSFDCRRVMVRHIAFARSHIKYSVLYYSLQSATSSGRALAWGSIMGRLDRRKARKSALHLPAGTRWGHRCTRVLFSHPLIMRCKTACTMRAAAKSAASWCIETAAAPCHVKLATC